MSNLYVINKTSKARGKVRAYSYSSDGSWHLLVELDHDSPPHTSIDALSIGPGQLASWHHLDVHVEGAP